MALEGNGGGTVMPVQPMYGGNGFGGDWGWFILLLLCCGFGGGFGGGYGANALGYDFPWLLTGQNGINANTNSGFQNAMLNDGINGIRSDINGLGNQICAGFAGVEQGANARQMADMQQNFAFQTSMLQGFNQLGTQFGDCCCENRLASCQTQNLIQNEGNATRFADANNTRDLMTTMNAGFQSIKDQLCADKIENKNDIIAQLRSELMFARGQASQDVQTAAIQAGQRTLANEIEQYVLPTPRPAYMVQNPNCCPQNVGCGCGSF